MKSKLWLWLIPIFIILMVISVLLYGEVSTNVKTSKNKNITGYSYTLNSSNTETMKNYYYALEKSLSSSDEDGIIKNVVSYFVCDFYGLSNKQNQIDVGGLTYVSPRYRKQFADSAKDTYYYNLKEYLEIYGSANLVEVSEVEVLSYNYGLELIDEVEYKSVDVTVSWNYKKSKQNSVLFPNNANIKLVLFDNEYGKAEYQIVSVESYNG